MIVCSRESTRFLGYTVIDQPFEAVKVGVLSALKESCGEEDEDGMSFSFTMGSLLLFVSTAPDMMC